MNKTHLKIFRDMFANGHTYTEIAVAIDGSVDEVRAFYKAEKKAGRMGGLTARRLKAKNTMSQEPVIEFIHEDGLEIPRHRAGYAIGVKPQVSAKSGASV